MEAEPGSDSLHLRPFAFVRDHLIQHRTHEKPNQQCEIRPATITIANDFCVSQLMPVESAAGSNPRHPTKARIMIVRSRGGDAVGVAG